MKLSVKSDYAARAILWLSRHYHEGVARKVEEMALEQGIPPKYLVQILIELKASHLVRSQRGKEGGYFLAKPPSEITLGDVIRSVHGEVFDSSALSDPKCPAELRASWKKLQEALDRTADSMNFQQLIDASERSKMYYI